MKQIITFLRKNAKYLHAYAFYARKQQMCVDCVKAYGEKINHLLTQNEKERLEAKDLDKLAMYTKMAHAYLCMGLSCAKAIAISQNRLKKKRVMFTHKACCLLIRFCPPLIRQQYID